MIQIVAIHNHHLKVSKNRQKDKLQKKRSREESKSMKALLSLKESIKLNNRRDKKEKIRSQKKKKRK